MEIDLKQLRTVTNRIFDHIIETRGLENVVLDEVFYWNIDPADRYNMDSSPGELDVGSLVDDWEFLSSLLDAQNQPVAAQLTEVAPLLLRIGEQLADQLASKGG